MADSLVAAAAETATGTTLFARSAQGTPGPLPVFVQVAEAHHAPQTLLRCSQLEIAQVAETYRVMGHAGAGVWGFEHGVNEHAVAIGRHALAGRELHSGARGLLAADLVRLGLERGRSAREALEVIAGLLEAHGQVPQAAGGAGQHAGLVLADPHEIWWLETSGRRWAAQRLRLAALSDRRRLRDDWEIGSRDLESFARSRGWWRSSERLDVSRAYAEEGLTDSVSAAERRAGVLLRADRGRHGPATAMGALRDPALCRDDALLRTQASLVASLPAAAGRPWPVWIGFGPPCAGFFLPVYLGGVIPAALARGGGSPGAGVGSKLDELAAAVAAEPESRGPLVAEGVRELEEKLDAERLEAEALAQRALDAEDGDRAAELLSDFMAHCVEAVLRRAEALRSALA